MQDAAATGPCERLRRYHAAIEARDFGAIGACFAECASYSSTGIGETKGRDAILASFRRYFARYSDQIASDSLVEAVSPHAARAVWWLKATDSATGEALERRGEEIVTFDAGGLIVSVLVTEAQ